MVQHFSIYDEIAAFVASMDPKRVAAFKPSKTSQNRLDDLLDKQKDEGLNQMEKTELEHYLIINRIIGLAKARALTLMVQ